MDVKPICAEEFDQRFDDGEDMADYVDWNSWRPANEASVVGDTPTPVQPLTLPEDLVRRVDLAAARAKISREALVARLITEGLDNAA